VASGRVASRRRARDWQQVMHGQRLGGVRAAGQGVSGGGDNIVGSMGAGVSSSFWLCENGNIVGC
jgi:hypothetical protein